jgi:hypothetical protein
MPRIQKVLIMALWATSPMLGVPSAGAAGHETGNGGGGLVCASGTTARVDLLDFWEGEVLRKLQIPQLDVNLDGALFKALAVYDRSGHHDLAESIHQRAVLIREKIGDGSGLPAGVQVAPPEDARNIFIEPGCQLVGIATYNDEFDTIDVDRDLYGKLSTTGRAGLIAHEAVYKVLRDEYGATDSRGARGITACLFATEPCPGLSVTDAVPDTGALRCSLEPGESTAETTFYLYFVPGQGGPGPDIRAPLWRLQFDEVAGLVPPAKTYFNLPASALVVTGSEVQSGRSFVRGRVYSRSSEDRWANIELPYSFDLKADANGGLRIDGRALRCVTP